jgi:hypothetical protein
MCKGKAARKRVALFVSVSAQPGLTICVQRCHWLRVVQIRAYLPEIFAEAVDQDFQPKDPAWKVEVSEQLADTTRRF